MDKVLETRSYIVVHQEYGGYGRKKLKKNSHAHIKR